MNENMKNYLNNVLFFSGGFISVVVYIRYTGWTNIRRCQAIMKFSSIFFSLFLPAVGNGTGSGSTMLKRGNLWESRHKF